MTIRRCDLCQKEVGEFAGRGSYYFPDGYQELCEACFPVVSEAVEKATSLARQEHEKFFMSHFQKLIGRHKETS